MNTKNHGVFGAIQICFGAARGAVCAKCLLEIISGALAPIMLLVVASFIDGVAALAGETGPVLPPVAAMLFMAAGYAYSQASPILIRLADKRLDNALREKLRPLLLRKQAAIPYALFEDAKTTDFIALVCTGTEARMRAILDAGLMLIRLVIQAFSVLYLLVGFVWWMPPLLIASAVPIFLIARKG